MAKPYYSWIRVVGLVKDNAMKKSVVIIFGVCGIGVALSLFLCSLLVQMLFQGCAWWECPPSRLFKVLDLGLPADIFPTGATYNTIHPLSEGEGARETGSQVVYWNQGDGRGIYIIRRFSTINEASQSFTHEENFFTDPSTGAPWKTSPTFHFTSVIADEFYMGCKMGSEPRCGMAARYKEYVVSFNAVIDSKMTEQKFENIVIFIDSLFSQHLYQTDLKDQSQTP